jgi:hypothetical protein
VRPSSSSDSGDRLSRSSLNHFNASRFALAAVVGSLRKRSMLDVTHGGQRLDSLRQQEKETERAASCADLQGGDPPKVLHPAGWRAGG